MIVENFKTKEEKVVKQLESDEFWILPLFFSIIYIIIKIISLYNFILENNCLTMNSQNSWNFNTGFVSWYKAYFHASGNKSVCEWW